MSEVLTEREETVLLGLLRRFVESCEPVGSKFLAEENPERLSPATIRAILGKLEEKGYLLQPHASAGRVPTDLAYHFFAKRAEDLPDPTLDGEPEEVDRLTAEGSLNGVVRGASSLLSRTTQVLGFAATPPLDALLLKECELVSLSKDRVLLVVVSRGGQVHECALVCDRPYDHETLRVFSNILNEAFRGLTFAEIRSRLRADLAAQGWAVLEGLGEALRAAHRLDPADEGPPVPPDPTLDARRLVAPYFLGTSERRHFFYDGMDHLLTSPALRGDLGALGALVEALEARGRLLELLDAFARGGVVVRVVLGDEWPGEDTRSLSMVVAPFDAGPAGRGLLGVIGPKPMRYDRNVPVVRSVARCVALAGSRL